MNESNPVTEEKVFVLTEKQVNAYNDWIVKGIVECDKSHLKEWKLKNPCPLPAPLSKAVSITDQAIKERANMGIYANSIEFDVRNMFISGAKWARDEMLKRNVISIKRDKPFDREGAIKCLKDYVAKRRSEHTGDSILLMPAPSDIIDALIEHLSSHLKEGEQRKPLEFEEWKIRYKNDHKETLPEYTRKDYEYMYEGYLTAFKQ